MNENDLLYWLWLIAIDGMGSAAIYKLLDVFETPEGIYCASDDQINDLIGIKPKQKQNITASRDLSLAKKAVRYMEKHQITLITMMDERYPEKLRDIYEPPAALFAKGDVSLLERPLSIGIVGSRKASPGGVAQATAFARELSAAGITIVSGFARGIDAAAHSASMTEIGSTIAVLGCGINVCYPKQNKDLYKQILANGGLILSEFFLDAAPIAFHFPMRNRIISGLSDGLLVVEASQKSGALITARHAADQGKNVYAIPKDITLVQGVGCSELIKDGAKVVTTAKDILEDYVLPESIRIAENHFAQTAATTTTTLPTGLSSDESKIYQLIQSGYNTVEQLEAVSGLDIRALNSILSMLELEDHIAVSYGNITLLM